MSPLHSRSPPCRLSPLSASPSITAAPMRLRCRCSRRSNSTALMLSKEATTDTSTQLSTNARNYFLALFTRPEATNVMVTASYDPNGGSALVVSASADVPTYLLGLLPGQAFQTLPVSASSTAKWGSNRLRVALVLDNTGSMADERQDDRAYIGHQKPADPVAKRRKQEWRCLCLDRSVREGRQPRRRQLEFGLHLLGHALDAGSRRCDQDRGDRQHLLGCHQRPVRGPGRNCPRYFQQL